MQTIENTQIKKIGLVYIAHYNQVCVRVTGKDFGVTIPFNRVPEFCRLFDVNWEDGEFIDVLNNQYARMILDGFKIIGFKHIIKDITYLIDEERKENK